MNRDYINDSNDNNGSCVCVEGRLGWRPGQVGALVDRLLCCHAVRLTGSQRGSLTQQLGPGSDFPTYA